MSEDAILDTERTSRWMAGQVPGIVTPLRFDLIAGGRSNLTYRVTDADGQLWALRRPPGGTALATAHDMEREWRFISALHGTGVPVAEPIAFSPDPDTCGAPCYVMGYVDGLVLADTPDGERMDPAARRRVAESTVDVLAALHRVDPAEVGLDDLRRPGNPVERQLRRWHRQVHQSAIEDLRLVDEVHAMLARNIPEPLPGVQHGDYRPGNISYGPDGTALAVFDWELATIGDTMIDVGWLLASWTDPGPPDQPEQPTTPGPTAAGGYPTRDEVRRRYEQQIGRELPNVPYHLAFARWRSACIVAGVYTRYLNGDMGNDGFDFSGYPERVRRQVESARDLLVGA